MVRERRLVVTECNLEKSNFNWFKSTYLADSSDSTTTSENQPPIERQHVESSGVWRGMTEETERHCQTPSERNEREKVQTEQIYAH